MYCVKCKPQNDISTGTGYTVPLISTSMTHPSNPGFVRACFRTLAMNATHTLFASEFSRLPLIVLGICSLTGVDPVVFSAGPYQWSTYQIHTGTQTCNRVSMQSSRFLALFSSLLSSLALMHSSFPTTHRVRFHGILHPFFKTFIESILTNITLLCCNEQHCLINGKNLPSLHTSPSFSL